MKLSQSKLDLEQLLRFENRLNEMNRLLDEVQALELTQSDLKSELESLGSYRDIQDVQEEIDQLQLKLYYLLTLNVR